MKEMPAKARIAQAPTPEASSVLSEREKRAWLRLIRTPQIGGVSFWELLAHFGSAEAALEALPEFAVRGGFSPRSIPSMNSINEELEQAAATHMTLVAAGEHGYPPLLARAEVPPPLLYIKGQANRVWDRPPLAVVGSRQASAAGLKFAAEISAALGSRGFDFGSGARSGRRCSPRGPSLCNLRRSSGWTGCDLSARTHNPRGGDREKRSLDQRMRSRFCRPRPGFSSKKSADFRELPGCRDRRSNGALGIANNRKACCRAKPGGVRCAGSSLRTEGGGHEPAFEGGRYPHDGTG